ncbi:hypothetical protein NDU88_003439 [Pleurodeles waltl]|uniref:Uncharacterized protein n=1 Tax=Pleurodeles waltl TaxID=8319 RepID=A0AAV7LFA8_PLEWA|nr:hypothetical protein NDU88_003439 [Pleurodeles waltl]
MGKCDEVGKSTVSGVGFGTLLVLVSIRILPGCGSGANNSKTSAVKLALLLRTANTRRRRLEIVVAGCHAGLPLHRQSLYSGIAYDLHLLDVANK